MSEKKTLEHNGYYGAYEWIPEEGLFHGKLTNIDDLVTFQGVDEDAVNQAFIDSVYDYQEGKV